MTDDRGRIVFAGTPEFAVPGLAVLADSAHDLVGVLTQPDRPAGRGRAVQASPVKQFAARHAIPVLQPQTLKDEGAQRQLAALAPDLIVVIAYGLLLPRAVLDLPRRGCVNVHASLLPRWRGASPIQAAVLAGDAETGVCLMRLEPGLDTGPVYARARTAIGPRETAGALHDRLARLGAELLAGHLDALVAGTLEAVPQPSVGVTYAGRIDKTDARIDWSRSAAQIDQQVRAHHPWPVADTELDGQRLRIWAARPVAQATGPACPGDVLAAGPEGIQVATGEGCLWLTEVQMPGRKRVPASEFARGHAVVGKRLGS